MNPATATAQLFTAEQFHEWAHRPENVNRWFELVRGEVIELPPPTRLHGVICGNVARILGNHAFAQGKGYVASNDSGVILERDPDTVRGPDIGYFEDAETMAEVHPKYGEVPPRLAVEVRSPTDRPSVLDRKIHDYLKNGVAVVWVVDPDGRMVTVHRHGQELTVVEGDQELTAEDILPGFRCRVADFFLLPGDKARAAPPG